MQLRIALVPLVGGLALSAVGTLGGSLAGRDRLFCLIAGAAAAALGLLRLSYRPAVRASTKQPRPLRLGWLDTVKAGICWLDGFKHTYTVDPGLYYLADEHDPGAPLLVTSNYHLTVFLVARQALRFGARLLVVDTDGINVWCAASKGQFVNQTIVDQVERYERSVLGPQGWLRLILPKRCLVGVSLHDLREQKIRGVIGPLRSRSLPAYLAETPLRDCNDDVLVFDLAARVFAWLPGLVQYLGYALLMVVALGAVGWFTGATAPLGLVAIVATLGTAYPLLFPWIPGRRFAVKGLWLGAALAAVVVAGARLGLWQAALEWPAALFAVGISIFIGLTFTGNSPVSAYTLVRKETAHFMPVSLLLLIGSAVVLLLVDSP